MLRWPIIASLGGLIHAEQDEHCLLQRPASFAHISHERSLLQQGTVFVVPPELSALEMLSEEHFGCGKACAYVAFGAMVAASIMRGLFTAQGWMQGTGGHQECESKKILEKECDSGE